ncbi:MAG: DNA primase [Saprospiraceae bacterium]|nr:DNA primase [Saprospiraceae bacterium]
MITQRSVQEILSVVRIEDIVGDFVTLKRKGANLGGLCPFHNEKTPSFNVNPVRNIFKCFGCGEGGDAVTFLMKHENISYPEALRYIAKKYNIAVEETEVTKEVLQEKQLADTLFIVNERALKFYQSQLFDTDKGKSIGLQYFKQRGFREETIRKWGLGYAPEHRDVLTKTLTTEGYSIENLRKVGLTSQYDNDFFRGRVMFTIQGLSGKPVAFAGRIMQSDAKVAKYINSPETEIYTKSRILYGLVHARKAIQQKDECILCEGYTDVISLHQAGIENVVASSGTSLTTDQIRLIKRFTPNIKIIYDGDAAGIKAAVRGLDMVLEEDMNVKVVLLPNKEDPDSYVQRIGATAFQEYIEKEAKDFIFFKTQTLLEEAAGDPIKKAKLVKDIVSSIAKIPDPVKRQLYIRECSALMRVEEAVLIGETGKIVRKNLEDKKAGRAAPTPSVSDEAGQPTDNQKVIEETFGEKKPQELEKSGTDYQDLDIARIIVMHGEALFIADRNITVADFILLDIEELINNIEDKLAKKILSEALNLLKNNEKVTQQFFLQNPSKEIRDFATNVFSSPFIYSENWENKLSRPLETQKMPDSNFEKDAIYALKRFKLVHIDKFMKISHSEIGKAIADKNVEQETKWLKIYMKYKAMHSILTKELGTVVLKSV